jgi:hypothetical protein
LLGFHRRTIASIKRATNRSTGRGHNRPAPVSFTLGGKMKRLILLFFPLACSLPLFAGLSGPIIVYQPWDLPLVAGELGLHKVEAWGSTPVYAVFAEYKRPHQNPDNPNVFGYQNANRAYFDGLKVQIENPVSNTLNVFLDYSACKKELAAIRFKSELENIIDGTGIAILYTANHSRVATSDDKVINKVVLHIKGYRGHLLPFKKTFEWGKVENKWEPK